jgi:hypothetical protein
MYSDIKLDISNLSVQVCGYHHGTCTSRCNITIKRKNNSITSCRATIKIQKKNPALTKPLTTSTQLKKARSDIRPLVIKLYFNLNFQNWNIWHWLNSEINQKIEEPNIINISYRSDVCIFQFFQNRATSRISSWP